MRHSIIFLLATSIKALPFLCADIVRVWLSRTFKLKGLFTLCDCHCDFFITTKNIKEWRIQLWWLVHILCHPVLPGGVPLSGFGYQIGDWVPDKGMVCKIGDGYQIGMGTRKGMGHQLRVGYQIGCTRYVMSDGMSDKEIGYQVEGPTTILSSLPLLGSKSCLATLHPSGPCSCLPVYI